MTRHSHHGYFRRLPGQRHYHCARCGLPYPTVRERVAHASLIRRPHEEDLR